jgi:hypothetical protein
MDNLIEDQTSEVLLSEWDDYAPILLNLLKLRAIDLKKIKDMKLLTPEVETIMLFDRDTDSIAIMYYVSEACRGPQKVLFFYSKYDPNEL